MLHKNPLQKARIGIEVRSADNGDVIYSHNADELLNPASNVKLVTATVAFAKLGAEFRFATDFSCDAPVTKGECKTLYIRGRGDPTLYTERIYGIAGDLAHRGLHKIGDIVVDDSYFDSEREGPGWEQEHGGDRPYMAPVGALSVNHNTVAVYVAPGDSEKAKGRIELEPQSDYFIVDNRVHTAPRHSRQRLTPRSVAEEGHQRIIVTGRLPLGKDTMVFYRKVDNPPIYAGETIKAILKARGVQVRGKVRQGTVPADAALIFVSKSDELATIVREMDKVSSNFIAEQLIKTVGAESQGPPGTWAKGIATAEELLASIGIAKGSYVMKNGSGLNDTNRFSAHQLTTLLTWVAQKTNFYPELASSLGIAGRDGTVRSRMEGTAAEGRLRAKTGTLESVTALSGYVRIANNENYVYSILTNDVNPRHHTPYLTAMDSLGAAIACGGLPEEKPKLPAAADGATLLTASGTSQAEMRARIQTYTNLGRMADATNLPFLHSALRTEHDPVMRAIIADAIFRSDKENGVGVLLDSVPTDAATFANLRTIAAQLSVPTPTVSSLIDIAADGNQDAVDKLLVLAHQAKGDTAVCLMISDGLQEIGRNAPDELFDALQRCPAEQSGDAIALLGEGIGSTDEKSLHPFLEHLKEITDAKAAVAANELSEKIRACFAPQRKVVTAPEEDEKNISVPAPASTTNALPGGG